MEKDLTSLQDNDVWAVYLGVYVDDIIVTAQSDKKLAEMKKEFGHNLISRTCETSSHICQEVCVE